jgi:hypothetical protein
MNEWYSFRTATLNRLRTGTRVVDITYDHEKQTLLRFLGWCKTIHGIEQPTMAVLQSQDVGKTVEAYSQWLAGRNLQWSSITNYLSAVTCADRARLVTLRLLTTDWHACRQLINAAQFACCEIEDIPDLAQLGNLRAQAEKMSKEAQLYKRKSPNWCRIQRPRNCPCWQ